MWRTRDKVLATLLFPFGFLPAVYLLLGAGYEARSCWTAPNGVTTCTGGISIWATVLGWVALLVSGVGPVVSAVVLGRRLSRAEA